MTLKPRFAPALAYRGLCSLDQSDYVAAEGWYRKAIAADPGAGDLHVLLAEALEKQGSGHSVEVRDELEKAIAIEPALAPAYLALGRLNLREQHPEAAIVPLQTALKLGSNQRQAHVYLSRAFYQLHEADKSAAEARLFKDEEAAAQAADRAAVQEAMRKLAKTRF